MGGAKDALLARLDAIASSLARRDGALALIGLGSVGAETDRLDAYSDLDFFVIVEQAYVELFVDSLAWLEEVAPVDFAFRNTPAGSKVLFADGMYAEFAVFDPATLRSIPFDAARVVWKREGADLSDAMVRPTAPLVPPTTEWLIGEILTNLYVGLSRLRRGESLSAQRLIQGHAVDRLLDLLPVIATVSGTSRDPFDGTRRAEQRFPQIAPYLGRFIQGYDRGPESALALLAFLQDRVRVNPVLSRRIVELAADIMAER